MLRYIRVFPLAAESLGVRSMCTYVETPDIRILLDGGVSLCPARFRLPPHPQEFKAIMKARQKISAAAETANIVTISHYHYDHVTPSFEDWLCNWTESDVTACGIYSGKTVLAKNPREDINYSQRERGWLFQKTSGRYVKEFLTADARFFVFGSTRVKFSEPVFHGAENSNLGWVLMATVEFQGERFLFAPDVQGPISERTVELILLERPQLLMIGGPPLYLVGSKVDADEIQNGLTNLKRIVRVVPHVIVDHHVLRDENWHETMDDVFYSAYQSDCTLQTAAEFSGERNSFLEARRKNLFQEDPPDKSFKDWMRKSEEARKHCKPPL